MARLNTAPGIEDLPSPAGAPFFTSPCAWPSLPAASPDAGGDLAPSSSWSNFFGGIGCGGRDNTRVCVCASLRLAQSKNRKRFL